MDPPYRPPNILRLSGVTLKDYVPVEDVADERLLTARDGCGDDEPDGRAFEPYHPPEKIPRVLTGLEEWPHGTNLRCWQCGFKFDGSPKFVPTHVREGENGGIEFGVHGNMCSFNCAELWISINYAGKEDQRWRAQDNLCLVYFLFTGRRTARIRPAPHKTELRQYGGELDEDAFWNKMRELDSVAGLRDHTPGSVVPERERPATVAEHERVKNALAVLRAGGGPLARDALGGRALAGGLAVLPGQKSVWGVCGLPAAAAMTTAAATTTAATAASTAATTTSATAATTTSATAATTTAAPTSAATTTSATTTSATTTSATAAAPTAAAAHPKPDNVEADELGLLLDELTADPVVAADSDIDALLDELVALGD